MEWNGRTCKIVKMMRKERLISNKEVNAREEKGKIRETAEEGRE